MLEKLQAQLQKHPFHVYDIALMTENGIEEATCIPCNRLNNSYSIAKLFTNTAIGMLADAGKLHLDDPLLKYLKPTLDFPYDKRWEQVTLRHALSHTTGIDQEFFDIDRDDPAMYATNDYLHYILAHPPQKTPGQYHLYTDAPHYLLSRVISQVTGRPADEMFRERILAPLQFYPSAFQRCPLGHTVGSTGAFVCARDLVKLGWLYLNQGEYQGQQLLSKAWVQTAEAEAFDLYPLRQGTCIGKAGVNGQMLVYCRSKKWALAWHGFETREKELRKVLLDAMEA